jgi:hypothetical protein
LDKINLDTVLEDFASRNALKYYSSIWGNHNS